MAQLLSPKTRQLIKMGLVVTALVTSLVIGLVFIRQQQDIRQQADVSSSTSRFSVTVPSTLEPGTVQSWPVVLEHSDPAILAGFQAVFSLRFTDDVPSDIQFTEAELEGWQAQVVLVEPIDQGREVRVIYAVSDFDQPPSTTYPVTVGTLTFTTPKQGQAQIDFNTTLTKIIQNQSLDNVVGSLPQYQVTVTLPATPVEPVTPIQPEQPVVASQPSTQEQQQSSITDGQDTLSNLDLGLSVAESSLPTSTSSPAGASTPTNPVVAQALAAETEAVVQAAVGGSTTSTLVSRSSSQNQLLAQATTQTSGSSTGTSNLSSSLPSPSPTPSPTLPATSLVRSLSSTSSASPSGLPQVLPQSGSFSAVWLAVGGGVLVLAGGWWRRAQMHHTE